MQLSCNKSIGRKQFTHKSNVTVKGIGNALGTRFQLDQLQCLVEPIDLRDCIEGRMCCAGIY